MGEGVNVWSYGATNTNVPAKLTVTVTYTALAYSAAVINLPSSGSLDRGHSGLPILRPAG